MKIGIDARFFGPQESGLSRYIQRLISYLETVDTHNQYVLFLRQQAWDVWEPKNWRWKKVEADYRWFTAAEQLHMPRIFRREKLDLLHVPHFNIPLGYTKPMVVTIHDLILNEFPTERASTLKPLIFKAKLLAYRFVIRQAVSRSAKIIAVSDYTKEQIVKSFNVPADKISVTYESVDPFPPPAPTATILRHDIKPPYLLYVGNSYPHKNIERLITATKRAWDAGERFQLVLVGKRDFFSKRLEESAIAHGIRNVLFYGFAPDDELGTLYREATAYFFPSLSEGFGLPGLEAMQAGLPVFAARAASLPEVFGSAAHYFRPTDIGDMVDSIRLALHDTMLKQRLTASGHERIRHFSWATMAQQTLSVYESAIRKQTPSKS
jgi:glycosyltransferase involved in cell wall biosynthesis